MAYISRVIDVEGDNYDIKSKKTEAIPFATATSSSCTTTAFVVDVDGITELANGVCCMIKNGTSITPTIDSAWTLNINSLGAKAVLHNKIPFRPDYCMRFLYDASLNSGAGGWRMSYGDTNSYAGINIDAGGSLNIYSDSSKQYSTIQLTDIGGVHCQGVYVYADNGTRMVRIGKDGHISPLGSSDYIADFVISAGTYGGWRYVLYNSGMLHVWYSRSISGLACSSAWGNVYTSAGVTRLTYPYAFAEAPYEQVTLVSTTSSSSSAWIVPYNTTGPSTTQTGQYQVVRPASSSSGLYTFLYHAYGVKASS